MKSKKNHRSLIGFFLWHPSIIGVRLSLWTALQHYRYHIPVRTRQALGNLVLRVARLRRKDMQHLKEILERRIMTLAIEVTNICNANCKFCAYRYSERAKGVMSSELFEHCMHRFAEAGGGILNLTPIVGDPLVDKDLITKIRFARQIEQVRYVYLYTNLIGLNSFNPKHLLSSGLDEIDISTCVSSKEMYRRIYGVDGYDCVMKNLDTLLQENRRLGNRVKVVIHLRGEGPYERITSSAEYRSIGERYGIRVCHVDDQYDNWTGLVDEDDLPQGQGFMQPQSMSEPCSELYNGMIIFLNGDVGACWRRDLEGKLVIGNVFESALEEIWTGEKLRRIREEWARGNVPLVCRKCYCYTPLSRFMLLSEATILGLEEGARATVCVSPHS